MKINRKGKFHSTEQKATSNEKVKVSFVISMLKSIKQNKKERRSKSPWGNSEVCLGT